MPLVYPPEFIQNILAEYPNHKNIRDSVDSGSYALGKYLAEEAAKSMAPEEIVLAFKKSRENVVLENARARIRRKALHAAWLRIMTQKISSLDDELNR
jgi:hypothetical protein